MRLLSSISLLDPNRCRVVHTTILWEGKEEESSPSGQRANVGEICTELRFIGNGSLATASSKLAARYHRTLALAAAKPRDDTSGPTTAPASIGPSWLCCLCPFSGHDFCYPLKIYLVCTFICFLVLKKC